jgi:PA domain/Secretion system C-terminal sorting domain
MKQNYSFKALLSGLLLASSGIAQAQCLHPLTYAAAASTSNWYSGFVGERFLVTYPSIIAGDKIFTTPNNGSGATGTWAGFPGAGGCVPLTVPYDTLINYPSDSCITSLPITIDMTGKVALVYRGAGVQFGVKALAAQTAGAVACVIVNNVPGGAVGMAAGTSGASVTIPVFMVSQADGDAMNNQLNEGIPVTINVFNWSAGNVNDLGFVDGGLAQWHNGAIPAYELQAGGDPIPYRGFDGAFVANFGSADASNVWLSATTSFTPTGGSTVQIHKDSVMLASFPQTDSIWAMYCPQYNLGSSITGNGIINVTYNVTSTATGWIDQFPFDNTASYQVYVTDNVYCKGRWDAANSRPFCTFYTGAGTNSAGTYDPYLWGPSYYVKQSRYANNSTMSLVAGTSTGVDYIIPGGSLNIYLFQWIDGWTNTVTGSTFPLDSIMQNGEFDLQGMAVINFDGATDSSFKFYNATYGDSTGNPANIMLDSNSWYWVAAEMEQSGSTNYSLGCDGVNNGYPRLLGRDTFNSYLEYYAPLWSAGDKSTSTNNLYTYSSYDCSIVPFGGTSYVTSIDSVVFANEKGLIPNISLATSPFATKTQNVKPVFAEFSVFPVPTATTLNVTLGLDKVAPQVTYRVLNTSGQVVSIETHSNVQNDTYAFSVEKLANGNYYMVVNANGKAMFKKFTVMH